MKSTGWLSVSMTPPPRDQWIHVWFEGRIALGKYAPQFPLPGVHDWLLLPPGRNPFAPYPSHHPRWWRLQPDPPSGEAGSEDPFPKSGGEEIVRWRGSVSDLYTDLFPLLTPEQLAELGKKLIGQPGGHVDRLASNAEYGKRGTKLTPEMRQVALSGVIEDCASLSTFASDLNAVLSRDDREKLCVELVYLGASSSPLPPQPASGSQQPAAGERSEPPVPVPLLLWCPECNERHIDRGEFATKPHHTHACQFCGHVWRPAIVPTTGVQFLPGFGPSSGSGAESQQVKAKSPERPLRCSETVPPRAAVVRHRPDDLSLRCSRDAGHLGPCQATNEIGTHYQWQAEYRASDGVGFWCPQTKSSCTRACVGSECLLEDHGSDCPERTF